MKFALAAGILAQTLPTLSEKVSSWDVRSTSNENLHATNLVAGAQQALRQKVGGRRLHPRRSLALQSEKVLINAQSDMDNHVPCDPNSVDPDTGVLSCGQGHICKADPAFKLGGVCSRSSYFDNEHQAFETHPSVSFMTRKSMNDLTRFQEIGYIEECDPDSPDTGILGCGHGKFCQQEESLALGGFCMLNDPSSRRLYTLEDAVTTFCNLPVSEGYPVCDCSGLNTTSGNGTVYCLYENETAGFNGCDDVIYSDTYWIYLSDSKFTKAYDCYEIKVPSYQKICITAVGENLNESCSISFNGQECSSCSPSDQFVDFDCTNVAGGTAGSTFPEAFPIIAECYVAPTYNCTNICGQGFHIPDYNSNINVTSSIGVLSCGQLLYYDQNMLIPDNLCAEANDLAQKECCVADATVPSNKPTMSPDVPNDSTGAPGGDNSTDAPGGDNATEAPGGDSGSAGSLQYAKYLIGQIGLVGCLVILLLKGT